MDAVTATVILLAAGYVSAVCFVGVFGSWRY